MRDIRPAQFGGGCSMLAKTSRHCNKNFRKPFRPVDFLAPDVYSLFDDAVPHLSRPSLKTN